MRTDDLLRKLAPLLPERVRWWRQYLDTADPALRRLLEQQIASVAYQRLRDPQDFLLSLPPREVARGAFHLGVLRYDTPRWPVGISADELVQHVAIFGRSGAGKTTVVFHLLEQFVARRVPFVFLDWKRTARHLLPRLHARVHVYTPGRDLAPFPFNPFLPPPGLDPRVYAHHVVDVLASAYTLGEGAKSLVTTALLACYTQSGDATPERVAEYVRAVPDQERVRSWKITALRALDALIGAHVGTSSASQEHVLRALLDQHTILELDGLAATAKAFLVPLVCLWLYQVRLAAVTRERLALVLVVEEAHHVLYPHTRGHETVMELLLRQCRELGIGIVVVDQHPHLLSSAALGNTYTSITLNLKDPTDVTKAAHLSLLNPDDAHHLSTLPVGRGVVKLQDRWHHPMLVDFPPVPLAKGSITDDVLRAYLRETATLSGRTRPTTPGIETLGRPRTSDEARMLDDITTHPNDGVDARYDRLRVSAEKGTRLKARLLALGLVQEARVRIGRTTRTLLRLTPRARDLPVGQHRHESLAHEYWKRWYASHYRTLGYEVTIEAPRPTGGRVDVLATRRPESVAIEVETGKSNTVENIRNDLRSGYRRVLVVATTDAAWARVWQSLQRAGLAIPRVTVVLREGGCRRRRDA